MAAAERMVERLQAVKWDDDAASAHKSSRARLTREFLRRTALWARAVGAEEGWPFSDLAGAVDPEVAVDPALLDRLAPDDESDDPYPVPPRFAAAVVRWAALGDLPRQRFPQLDDPYEPMLEVFARGGGYARSSGMIELGYNAFPIGVLAERAELEPAPIDPASLDALDRGVS
jgi:hypothetical protein